MTKVRKLRESAWWRLVVLCVGLNVVESVFVIVFDDGSRPDLAPQASAIAPFGVFHDLRWVSVYHDSWLVFVLEIVAVLAFRAIVTAVSVSLARPESAQRPSNARLVRGGLLSSVVAALFLAPSVTLLFGLATVPVSWLFIAAVPAAVLVALVVHPVGITPDWWKRVLSLRAVGWVVLTFLVFTLSSAAMAYSPKWVWLIVSALAGVFNAWSWTGLVHAVVDRRPARHTAPMVPVALALLVGVVIIGTVLGFSHARPAREATGPRTSSVDRTDTPVLIVSGYGSTWNGRSKHPIPGPFYEEEFSYRGLDKGGRPLAYSSADTVKAIPDLDRLFLGEVSALAQLTGKRIDVVAESEGALVAKTALLADPEAPVRQLVLASPLVAPDRVSYPVRRSSGWGIASDAGMKLLSRAFQSVSPIDLSPDSAFLSSVDQDAAELQKAMTCQIAGVRQFALLPLADATATPARTNLPFPSDVVAAFHGGLVESRSSSSLVAQVLERRTVTDDGLLRFADDAISSASGAWQVPPLVASDFPSAGPRSILGATSCRAVETSLHREVF